MHQSSQLDWEVLWPVGLFHRETVIQQKLLVRGMWIVMDLSWEKGLVCLFWKNLSMQSKEVRKYMLNFLEEASRVMHIT
uniref:Pco121523 n=1 Tax=Arundo donax TaxID=35708 RepID=A0A0A9D5H3_ARUDO